MRLRYYGLALVLALLLFWPWLNNYFCSDDWPAILRSVRLSWPEIPGWFTTLRGGSYRPLHDVFVALCWRLFGLNPLGYRLVSIVLYALVSANVGVLAHLLTGDGRAGALSTLLFSVFATHAEPVLWFAATNELLAGLFVLLSTTSYVSFRRTGNRWWLVAAGLNGLLGFTSKETALLWPLTLLVYDALWFEPTGGKKLDGRFIWPALGVVVLWLAFLSFRIPLGSAYTSAVDYGVPRLAMNLAYYVLIGAFALPNNYAFLAAWPAWQARPALPIVALVSSTTVIAITSWLWVRERICATRRPYKRALLFSCVWVVVAVAPIIFIVAERSVFMSSVGIVLAFCVALVGAWDVAKERGKWMKRAVAVSVVLYVGLNASVLAYRSAWFGRSAQTSRAVLAQLEGEIERLPAGRPVLLVNLPDHLEYTFTFRNTFPSAARVLGYDRAVESVLDTALRPLSPREQEDYIDQRRRAPDAAVFWYRDGELVPE
ncbi:MAG TPA: hypothetical protein VMY40_06145 [Anaerolineae bacterium]|nr:hypothetical protein [Anaerolineae bacterium]